MDPHVFNLLIQGRGIELQRFLRLPAPHDNTYINVEQITAIKVL